jgi:hypothetical protein
MTLFGSHPAVSQSRCVAAQTGRLKPCVNILSDVGTRRGGTRRRRAKVTFSRGQWKPFRQDPEHACDGPRPVERFSPRTALLSKRDGTPGTGRPARRRSGKRALKDSSVEPTVWPQGYNSGQHCCLPPTFPTAFSGEPNRS